MAKFINRRFHPRTKVDADHLIFANGVTGLCEMLGLGLCNSGDGILFSRPIYQAFKGDFGMIAKLVTPPREFGCVCEREI
jgi:aspartate/methionine/tyrosine aminotransferase